MNCENQQFLDVVKKQFLYGSELFIDKHIFTTALGSWCYINSEEEEEALQDVAGSVTSVHPSSLL